MEDLAGKIIERIALMEEKLEDLKKRWPAHSVKPQMIMEMEQIEEEIELLREEYRKKIAH